MTEKKTKKTDYEKVITDFSKAMRAYRRKDYKRAIEFLEAFKEKYGDELEFVDRAKVYLKICEGKKKETPIKLKTFDDYYYYGTIRMNEGEYKDSLKLLSKAREMKPKEGKVYYLMSTVYCRMGETDQCLEHLRKSIHIDKNFQVKAQNEVDFESLWEDKRFMLITRMK